MPSPRSTMALVPLTGQSRKPRLRAPTSRASRSVSIGEMVLICMTVRPARAPARMPSGPRIAASAAASDGRRVQMASDDCATAEAEGAALPPVAVRAATRSGRTSKPTTAWPALIRRAATAEPSRPRPTRPTVAIRRSAVLAWRVVARVDGVLQEVLGLVGPELGHVRKGLDHGVLELAAHALDLADVDVLDRVAEVVEAHGAARRIGEVHLAKGGQELLRVLDIATCRLERGLERDARDVRPFRVIRGDLLELGLVGLGELAVGRGGEGRRVVERRDDAQDLVAHGAEHVLVGEGAAADQGQLALEARVRVLLGEAQGVGAGKDGIDRVHVPSELGEVGREVRGVERRPELLDHLTARLLERAVEARRHFPAEGEVIADDRDLSIAEIVIDPLAEGMGGLRAAPADANDVRAALALGDVFRGDDGEDGRHLLAVRVRRDSIADRGGERADQQVDALALDEAARLGEARGGLPLVILGDQLDLAAGQAPALLLEEELHAVGHVLAIGGQWARLRQEKADLDRPLLRPADSRHGDEECGAEDESDRQCLAHERLLVRASV